MKNKLEKYNNEQEIKDLQDYLNIPETGIIDEKTKESLLKHIEDSKFENTVYYKNKLKDKNLENSKENLLNIGIETILKELYKEEICKIMTFFKKCTDDNYESVPYDSEYHDSEEYQKMFREGGRIETYQEGGKAKQVITKKPKYKDVTIGELRQFSSASGDNKIQRALNKSKLYDLDDDKVVRIYSDNTFEVKGGGPQIGIKQGETALSTSNWLGKGNVRASNEIARYIAKNEEWKEDALPVKEETKEDSSTETESSSVETEDLKETNKQEIPVVNQKTKKGASGGSYKPSNIELPDVLTNFKKSGESDKDVVKRFQEFAGIKVDGDFGKNSMLAWTKLGNQWTNKQIEEEEEGEDWGKKEESKFNKEELKKDLQDITNPYVYDDKEKQRLLDWYKTITRKKPTDFISQASRQKYMGDVNDFNLALKRYNLKNPKLMESLNFDFKKDSFNTGGNIPSFQLGSTIPSINKWKYNAFGDKSLGSNIDFSKFGGNNKSASLVTGKLIEPEMSKKYTHDYFSMLPPTLSSLPDKIPGVENNKTEVVEKQGSKVGNFLRGITNRDKSRIEGAKQVGAEGLVDDGKKKINFDRSSLARIAELIMNKPTNVNLKNPDFLYSTISGIKTPSNVYQNIDRQVRTAQRSVPRTSQGAINKAVQSSIATKGIEAKSNASQQMEQMKQAEENRLAQALAQQTGRKQQYLFQTADSENKARLQKAINDNAYKQAIAEEVGNQVRGTTLEEKAALRASIPMLQQKESQERNENLSNIRQEYIQKAKEIDSSLSDEQKKAKMTELTKEMNNQLLEAVKRSKLTATDWFEYYKNPTQNLNR